MFATTVTHNLHRSILASLLPANPVKQPPARAPRDQEREYLRLQARHQMAVEKLYWEEIRMMSGPQR